MAVLSIIFTVLVVTVSILIVMVVLLQRPKQEGLGAAFGGSTLDGALGAQTTDVLQKATTLFAGIFFFCSIGLAMVKTRQFDKSGSKNILDKMSEQEAALPTIPDGLSPAIIPGDTLNNFPVTPALPEDPLSPAPDAPAPDAPAPDAPAPDAPAPDAPAPDAPAPDAPAPDAPAPETEDAPSEN